MCPGWRGFAFAQADLAAWDDVALSEFCSPASRTARRAVQAAARAHQLIHGDLTTNVLFHPALPPGIIDPSPYWRPPLFATAIVVFDAMVWEGAGHSVLPLIGHRPHAVQYRITRRPGPRPRPLRAIILLLCATLLRANPLMVRAV